ncbi:7-deoxyloganetin glucosyltransferase [Beta vulgaris subsp. vulgaris]|uniref:7-deoxyloganetin glucosyltransferase n=1 Tax=Beta vulgaris subsp. vulgaris TaxID=3555 RepID=UPI00203765DA|nr:7-deoxyloganetin glucosyltransferase [Beta vulgaris subsp. vulgaris]
MGSCNSDEKEAKIHVVCIPYPAQGHIRPMLKLAKLLHSKGFHITFVNTEYNHRRLLRARGPNFLDAVSSFRFEAIPDGLPTSDADATQDIPTLCHAVMNYFLEPFKQLLVKLNDPSSGLPRVTLILSDCVMPFTLDAAQQLGGIPLVWLWTASACGFLGYSQYRPLLDKGIVPFKDSKFATDGSLGMVVDWVPSMRGIQLKYIPSFIRTTDKDDIMLNFLIVATERAAQSSAPIIFNSFNTFEHDVLEDLSEIIVGPTYTIGPMQLQLKNVSDDAGVKSLGSNLWKEDSECFNWLDSKKPKSVVYVSFGSITTMTNENLIEFAWGLANSKHPFLWILRPDIVSGDSAVIPPEFLAETKDRGLITSWCDQETVLDHTSIGAFLTHCGWNSILDTICSGVPVICWPFFAEQQTNCWFISEKWGIGMEIDNNVRRSEVEKQVRELMEEKKGEEMTRKAMEWKILAEEAAATPSGSSCSNFDNLVNQVILPLKAYKKSSQN